MLVVLVPDKRCQHSLLIPVERVGRLRLLSFFSLISFILLRRSVFTPQTKNFQFDVMLAVADGLVVAHSTSDFPLLSGIGKRLAIGEYGRCSRIERSNLRPTAVSTSPTIFTGFFASYFFVLYEMVYLRFYNIIIDEKTGDFFFVLNNGEVKLAVN